MHIAPRESLESQDPFRSLLANWNKNPLFGIQAQDLAWNRHGQDLVQYQRVRLGGVQALIAAATTQGTRAGIAANSLWLCLWEPIENGQEANFVADFCRLGSALGKSCLSIGGDEFHFVPGLPLDQANSAALQLAFQAAGFVGSEEVDFIGDPRSQAVAKYIAEAKASAAMQNLQLVEAKLASLTALESFLAKEFPGRWLRELQFWRAQSENPKIATWHLLQDKQNSQILGFARTAMRGPANSTNRWTPGALRLALGESESPTDSCLGPIGLAKAARGHGTGRILLGLTLASLLEQGAALTCIDWTDALGFYKPLEFSIKRRYWCGRKQFS